jgi:hypothetical protein
MDLFRTKLQPILSAAKKLLKFPFWVRLSGLIFLLIFCFSATCLVIFNKHQKIKNLSNEITILARRKEMVEKQKALRKKMEEKILKSQSDYLKKTVETLPLLQGERVRVATLAKQFPDNASLKERLLFLDSDQNHIQFETLQEGADLQHHLSHPVQMDLSDLRKFLEAVEGDRYDATQKKPFLVMKKFDLLKCYEKGDEKVYSIHAELIEKR